MALDTNIYLSTLTGAIYSWDPATKSTQLLAETGLTLTDIAIASDGSMFAITWDSLYRINTVNGNATFVGSLRSDSELFSGVNQLTSANGFDISPEGVGRISSSNNTIVATVNLETGKVSNIAGPLFKPGQFSAGDIWFEGTKLHVTTTSSTLIEAVPTTVNNIPTCREAIENEFFIGSSEVWGLVGIPARVHDIPENTLLGFNDKTAYLLGPDQLIPGSIYATLDVEGSISGAAMQREISFIPENPKPELETTSDNIMVAALNLSARAYSDTHHGDQSVISAINDHIKNWTPLEATDLGFSVTDSRFSKVGNAVCGDLLRYDFKNASATVGLTVLDGKRTLGISFEGTNSVLTLDGITDLLQDAGYIDSYYNSLFDFNKAIYKYVMQSTNNIEQVLVTGHSLGGSAAQNFMIDYSSLSSKFIGITFGSPGSGSPGSNIVTTLSKDRFVNIQHNGDEVPFLGKANGYEFSGSVINVDVEDSGVLREHTLYTPLDNSKASYRETIEFITSQLDPKTLFQDMNIVPGTDGDDNLNARAGKNGEILLGGRGNDTMKGGLIDGLDTQIFKGGLGNDTIDGDGGVDYATYGGARSNFVLQQDSVFLLNGFLFPDKWTISDQRLAPGSEGIDTLENIERLDFTDSALALDLDNSAGKVAKLIGAVFGAESISKPEYVAVGLYYLDNGTSYEDLATGAIQLAGTNTPEQVVTLLWTNVVGSPPTTDQMQPFVKSNDQPINSS